MGRIYFRSISEVLMKTFYDNQIRPLSVKLDEAMGVKHIDVTYVDRGYDWDPTRYDVPVTVKYYLAPNNYKFFKNSYIKSLKAMGLI